MLPRYLFCIYILCIKNVHSNVEIRRIFDPRPQCPLDLGILDNLDETSVLFIKHGCDVEPDVSDKVLKALVLHRDVIIGSCDHISSSYTHKNIVILTNSLNYTFWNEFCRGTPKNNYEQHPLILIISLYNRFHCVDGKASKDLMEYVQSFLDNLWRQHHFFHVSLSLPYVCPDYYFTYKEMHKNEGARYNLKIELVPNSWRMLRGDRNMDYTQGFPFRVKMFERFPTSILDCKKIHDYVRTNLSASGGFCGGDGLVLADIVQHFGFNVTVLSGGHFGYQMTNGSVTDSLLDVETGTADSSFVSRFFDPKSKLNVVPLGYDYIDCLCAVVRGGKQVPLWLFPFNAIKFSTAIFMVSTFSFVVIFSYYISKFKFTQRIKHGSLYFYVFDTISTGLFLASNNSKLPKLNKFIKSLFIASSVVFTAYYQVKVNYLFAHEVFEKTPTSKRELLDFAVKIYTTDGIRRFLENEPFDDTIKMLERTTILPKSIHSVKYVLDSTEKTATIRRKSDYYMDAIKYHSDNYSLSLIDDPYKCFCLVYIMRPDFPFQGDVIQTLQRLNEAGLHQKYYEWTRRSLGYFWTKPPAAAPRTRTPVRLQDLQVAFYLLGAGYILCLVCFALELYWYHRKRTNAID